MKWKSSIIVFFYIFCQLAVGADNNPIKTDLSPWNYRKKIEVTGEGKYAYFFSDSDIYRYSNISLSDLRIADSDTNLIPYYIKDEYTEQNKEKYSFASKNIKTFTDKNGNTYFDFQIFPDRKIIHVNILNLQFRDDEFSCQVEIYGRDESSDWMFLEKATIFKFSDMEKREIRLKENYNFSFYRIKTLNQTDKSLIKSLVVEGMDYTSQNQNFQKNTNLEFTVENKKGLSLITIKNPHHLKIIKIQLNTSGNFNREYSLYSDSISVWLSSGRIYNFNHNTIQIFNKDIFIPKGSNVNDNLILKIVNNDNEPLEISGISAVYFVDKVIFENKGKKPLYVYFGNENAPHPVFDILSFSKYIDSLKINEALLFEMEILKKKIITTEKKDYTKFFNVLISVIAFALIVIIVLKLKN